MQPQHAASRCQYHARPPPLRGLPSRLRHPEAAPSRRPCGRDTFLSITHSQRFYLNGALLDLVVALKASKKGPPGVSRVELQRVVEIVLRTMQALVLIDNRDLGAA